MQPAETMMVRMEQAAGGRWNVQQVGSDDPLASFDDIEQCVDYACELERNRQAVVVQDFGQSLY